MIINNHTNYKHFISKVIKSAVIDKTPVFFQDALNNIASRKTLPRNDNSLDSNFNNLSLPQNCAISKEKIENTTQNANDKITENVEEAKDIFTICFECENKEECEHYQKMINGDESVKGNAIFSPIKTSKSFHKNEATMQEQLLQEELYKLTGSSIIYNYNIICPDMNIKTKREKR